jgi:hypothetical protein
MVGWSFTFIRAVEKFLPHWIQDIGAHKAGTIAKWLDYVIASGV